MFRDTGKIKTRFPRSINYIVGNEAAERFSFYGMKAILTTFLVTQFFNPTNNEALQKTAEAAANEKTHLFYTLTYFLPVLGGLAADWFFGKYRIILWLSVVYCIGNFIMAASVNNLNIFLIGLMLIAVGAGGIKPNVSANVGDQFDSKNQQLISKAFSIFYFSINFGSFFSTLLLPVILQRFGPVIAFGLPGILMVISIIVFIAGNKQFVKKPPIGFRKVNFVSVNGYMLWKLFTGKKGESVIDQARKKFSSESVNAIMQVWKILATFAFIPVFWALYDQNSSEWVLQATHLNLRLAGVTWLPQQIQSVNPILILAFIPLFSGYFYPALEKRGINFTPYRKIATGLILTALSFIIIYFIQLKIDAGGTPPVIYQVFAYIILTAAEVLISITGLEYAYTQAPESMKSTLMSFWLLTVSAGNFLVTLINSNIAAGGFLAKLEGANYYLFFIIVMLLTITVFLFVSRKWNRQHDTQMNLVPA